MKSNRGTKRGCVWNNNTCCHWAGDASPRTCRTLCANRLRKSKRTTLIRMKGLVAGLPAAQHTHSQRCAAASQCVVALCLVCLSSLLLEEQEAVLDYFQREDKGAGRVRVSWAPPPSSSEDLSVSWGVCECGVQRSESVVNIIHRHRNQKDGSLASTCTCGATISYLKQPKQEVTAIKMSERALCQDGRTNGCYSTFLRFH